MTLISWYRVFHERFIVAKPVRKFRIFKELKVHYRVHKNPPYDPIVNQFSPVWILTSFFFLSRIFIFLYYPTYYYMSQGIFYLEIFRSKFHIYFSSLPYATSFSHLTIHQFL
jgi:hypothetical protein